MPYAETSFCSQNTFNSNRLHIFVTCPFAIDPPGKKARGVPMTMAHPLTDYLDTGFQEPAILGREADHRVANNLGLIISLLRMRARSVTQRPGKIDREEVGVLLEDIAARVETVARLHRMLSQSYRHALVDLGIYLRELCSSLTSSLAGDSKVTFSYDNGTCALPPDQVLTFGLLVSELVTNSVKYAHPTGLPVKIALRCQPSADGVVVEFSDDGIGLPENFDPQVDGGLGLRIVRSLAAQLHGKIEFRSSPLGTSVRLEIPGDATPA
jgi:two-component sensor histidine kinase